MTTASREPMADPLYARPLPERPAYATGILLDAQDFSDEQTYHRGRLARALAQLCGTTTGGGTLAGSRVGWRADGAAGPEEVQVEAGVHVDRLGRLVEITRPACIRLQRWFDAQFALDGGDTLRRAAYDNLARFVSPRTPADNAVAALPARAVVADVFVRFIACEHGYTPAFASGPFDALDAVAVSRLRDAWELQLVARTDLSDTRDGLPEQGLDLVATADLDERRALLQDAVFGAYPPSGRSGDTDPLPAPVGHPDGIDRSALFLARVLLPVGAADPPARTLDPVLVDNRRRRFIPASTLLARFVGA